MAQTICILSAAEDRERLLAIVADRNRPVKHVQRANIILRSAERLRVLEVALPTGASRPAVWRWQARYAEQGVDGLLRDEGSVGNLVCGAGFSSGSDEAFAEHDGELGFGFGPFAGGIFHSCPTWRKTRKMSFVTASSLGKWPLARTARQSLAFNASIAFVTGMREAGAEDPAVGDELAAYGATIRD